jgi:excinuclease ABC subunit A
VSNSIVIRNAHEHNLKNVDLEIPRDAMVVITGVSGSGKSSLAFDTLFQEGQRRYVESLSSYARQFIGSMKRPEVESIRGISPTISIDQKTINRNPRSTVGTVVEIMDHYRLLFSRLGVPHCPKCKKEIHAQSVEQIVDGLYTDHEGRQVTILSPIVQERKGEYRKEIKDLQEAGFVRARVDGVIYRLEDVPQLVRYEKHTIEAVIDRLSLDPKNISRVREGVEGALKRSDHLVAFLFENGTPDSMAEFSASPFLESPQRAPDSRPQERRNSSSISSAENAADGVRSGDSPPKSPQRAPDARPQARRNSSSISSAENAADGVRSGDFPQESSQRALSARPQERRNSSSISSAENAADGVRSGDSPPKSPQRALSARPQERRNSLSISSDENAAIGARSGDFPVEYLLLGTKLACPTCRISIPELEPRLFSFNDAQGQCPQCKGLGRHFQFEEDLLIPDPSLSIQGGAIKPQVAAGNIMFSKHGWAEFRALAKHYGFSLDTPWQDLPKKARDMVLFGSDEPIKWRAQREGWHGPKIVDKFEPIPGVIPVLQQLWDQWHISLLQKYMHEELCSTCQGSRLNPISLAVLFHDRNISELSRWSVEKSTQFFNSLELAPREERVGREIFKEIRSRLGFLDHVGLGYLTLDRGAATLSGGEAQRIRLAGQVGAGLQGVLYVLDEPSIGLHPRDNEKLLDILDRLRRQGNTLVIVEHDEDTMRRADLVVDIGPGAGSQGGKVVAQGHWEELARNPHSLTGQYLSGRKSIPIPVQRRPTSNKWLQVIGATENNLKNIDVKFPIGIFTVVTGVSGSGKSTLVNQILRKALAAHFHGALEVPGKHKKIEGLEHLDKVIEIDQTAIGRTPRSNPATYTKIFDDIRDLFAALPESKIRGYSKSRFSFNVPGGRCEECEGAGVKSIEMQILPNVEVPCEACNRKRFNDATLEIHFKGKTIADVLAMTIAEATEFFRDHPKLRKPLDVLMDLGLSYLQLGQPSTTLSGGEAQRMKISTELRRPGTGRTLYLLDEPTTGLHFEDISRLLECLQRLVEKGNTMIVIEHNLDVVKCADWVIDMGPEAGEKGGELLVTGTPEKIAQAKNSHTGRVLQPLLEKHATALSNPSQGYLMAAERPQVPYKVTPDLDIVVQGARKHNLKNFTVRIPRHKMTVVTGLSGSGKSSLAFHTLFAEGQRRFVESLSTYARRFLGKVDRGMVDSIQGLAPSIAIDQGSASRSPRSTVATMTELYDYFRILWARVGAPHCVHCGKATCRHSTADVADIAGKKSGMVQVLFPLFLNNVARSFMAKEAGQVTGLADRLTELGFRRLLVDGKWLELPGAKIPSSLKSAWVVVDRVPVNAASRARLVEAVEKAYEEGNGLLGLLGEGVKPELYSQVPGCSDCGWYLEHDLDPKNFSFNSHWGACETCQGLGKLNGSFCFSCEGERLKPEFRNVRIAGQNVSQTSSLTISQAIHWFDDLKLDGASRKISAPLLREIHGRLEFLLGVGLDYLGLDRSGETLSGGEAQRIRLASQIGSGLEGVLYVLDEPTVGLHQRDTQQLLDTLYRLRELGNTLVVVEHDLEFIRSADHLLDLGPGAGEFGGEVVAEGTPKALSSKAALAKFPLSQTVPFLAGKVRVSSDHPFRPVGEGDCPWIRLENLRKNNIQDVSVKIPVGRVTAVSGVSGSGKSSLVMDCLLPLVANAIKPRSRKNLAMGKIQMPEGFTEVQLVDQDPLGGTPRSTPASYTGVLDSLRKLYASLPQAKLKGFGIGRFSYNKFEGRCPTCEGRGFIEIEMHFLSDVWELCESCKGRRYNAETLTVLFRGKSIADVLEMRVDEAVEFFQDHKSMIKPLRLLKEVGLGYLRLGQSATTLSGGEAQRLKLATELARSARSAKGVLYLLDEPTTGLHLRDIQALWNVIQGLADQGSTVVLVEHHPDMIRLADWVIDLGPEGGDKGGKVLFQGAVADFLAQKGKNATREALLRK